MTDPENIRAVAEGLSYPAQCVLAGFDEDWQFLEMRGNSSAHWLRSKGLLQKRFRDHPVRYGRAPQYRITPFGLAVRSYLEAQND